MVEEPKISVIMGSQSDWTTMQSAADALHQFGVPHEVKIISAHRTPERMAEFSKSTRSRGIKAIIAGAGGAAHLPGMIAAMTTVPVFGVPVESGSLDGMDSLLSIVQMPRGVPVGTLAIGARGAENAALLAIAVLANEDEALLKKLEDFRARQTASVNEEVTR